MCIYLKKFQVNVQINTEKLFGTGKCVFVFHFLKMSISEGLDDRWEYKWPGAYMLSICTHHLSQENFKVVIF